MFFRVFFFLLLFYILISFSKIPSASCVAAVVVTAWMLLLLSLFRTCMDLIIVARIKRRLCHTSLLQKHKLHTHTQRQSFDMRAEINTLFHFYEDHKNVPPPKSGSAAYARFTSFFVGIKILYGPINSILFHLAELEYKFGWPF